MRILLALPLLALTAAAPARREAFGPPLPPTPYDLCDGAIAAAQAKPIPDTLLPAIARVESGRPDPATGRTRPWPWTINAEGTGSFFDTKEQAIAAVTQLQAKGIRSIDVGCMQVNLFFHPDAFADLDTAFDPAANARYAVRFLTSLYSQTKDWGLATAYYHSQSQDPGEDYQRRVFGRVMTPMGPPKSRNPYGWPPANAMFAAIPPASAMFAAIPPASAAFAAIPPRTIGFTVQAPTPPQPSKPAKR